MNKKYERTGIYVNGRQKTLDRINGWYSEYKVISISNSVDDGFSVGLEKEIENV